MQSDCCGSTLAQELPQSAAAEKNHSKVILQGLFESSSRTAEMFRKKIVYTFKSDGYSFQKTFMNLV